LVLLSVAVNTVTGFELAGYVKLTHPSGAQRMEHAIVRDEGILHVGGRGSKSRREGA